MADAVLIAFICFLMVAMFVLPFYGLWLIAVGLGANGSLAAGVIIVGSLLIGGIVAAKNQ